MSRSWRPWAKPEQRLTTKAADSRRNRPGTRYTLLIDDVATGTVRSAEDGGWFAFDTSIRRVGGVTLYCNLSKAGDALARRTS